MRPILLAILGVQLTIIGGVFVIDPGTTSTPLEPILLFGGLFLTLFAINLDLRDQHQ